MEAEGRNILDWEDSKSEGESALGIENEKKLERNGMTQEGKRKALFNTPRVVQTGKQDFLFLSCTLID